MGTPIRVMLVGEYRVALLGLERLINERRPAMEIVATATSCALVCTLAEQLLPDVVVIDPEHGCENVGEIIPTLVADYGARVLMLVGQRDRSIRESFVLRGASGVVQKDEAPETLLKAIEKVHCGELWLDRSTTGKLFVEMARRKSGAGADPEQIRLATLTQREHDVVRKLVTQARRGQQEPRDEPAHRRAHAAQSPEPYLRQARRAEPSGVVRFCHAQRPDGLATIFCRWPLGRGPERRCEAGDDYRRQDDLENRLGQTRRRVPCAIALLDAVGDHLLGCEIVHSSVRQPRGPGNRNFRLVAANRS